MSYYKTTKTHKTRINTHKELREGQSIEEVMRINTANKTKPDATTMLPEIYQERKEGIDPLCDIRTDKFDMALDAADKVNRAYLLASQNKDKLDKGGDNTWITDEDGNPMFEAPSANTQTE